MSLPTTYGPTTCSVSHLPLMVLKSLFPSLDAQLAREHHCGHIFTRSRWIPDWGVWVGDVEHNAEHGHLLLPWPVSRGHQSTLKHLHGQLAHLFTQFPTENRVQNASQSPKVSNTHGTMWSGGLYLQAHVVKRV